MKAMKVLVPLIALAVLGLFLASCVAPVTPPAVKKTFSKGTVTAKGSVFVNGVEYTDTTATITVNGVAATDADLKVGMHVELKGDSDGTAGTATTIASNNSMEGLVDTVGATSFTIFGQTVNVDAGTKFESPLTGLASLTAGVTVADITAYPDGLGGYIATHVEETTAATYEIDGTVSASAAGSFTLTPAGGSPISVSYTGTLAAAIIDGAFVEVKFGAFSATAPNITTTAAQIELKVELTPDEGDLMEVEGYVSGLAAPAFSVDGVQVDAGTLSLSGIANGTKVEVTGTYTAGVLMATQIQIK